MRPHRRDALIEFIKSLLLTPFLLDQGTQRRIEAYSEIFANVDGWIVEHIKRRVNGSEDQSKLARLVPGVGAFFTPLPLHSAFLEYDAQFALSARVHVPPSFNDIRNILNLAQVNAIAQHVQLVSFDGDQTLYEDGLNFTDDFALSGHLILLLRKGIYVAVVTAAGYAGEPSRYEQRLSGLFDRFREANLSPDVLQRFFVLGGECNYLFRCNAYARLDTVPDELFFTEEMRRWTPEAVDRLMQVAEQSLRERIETMRLKTVSVVRKPRGVGIFLSKDMVPLAREQLDELALAAQYQMTKANFDIPFCAFNGGRDVWVDVGNKRIGVQCLQQFLKTTPDNTLHFGDQFLTTGNDLATRQACSTVWISNPKETSSMLAQLLRQRTSNKPVDSVEGS